jgi:hypothetical protein
MKNKFKVVSIAITALLVFSTTACFGQSRSVNSADDLKKYLDSQPANSADKPIRVAMKANDDSMLNDIRPVIQNARKYVSLDLSGSPLTTIGVESWAFLRCTSLTSIIIPNGVTSIGDNAFFECTDLTGITIPNSVTSIGLGAFANCTSLASVTIPDSVTSIGKAAFGSCRSLTSVTIPNSVTSISVNAFNGCTSLKSVTIPDSVTSIEDNAFAYCTSLTSVTIPNSVTYIFDNAFGSCTSLTSVTFEGTISSYFANNAFNNLGDLHDKYLAGGPGTYTTNAPVGARSVWIKQ